MKDKFDSIIEEYTEKADMTFRAYEQKEMNWTQYNEYMDMLMEEMRTKIKNIFTNNK